MQGKNRSLKQIPYVKLYKSVIANAMYVHKVNPVHSSWSGVRLVTTIFGLKSPYLQINSEHTHTSPAFTYPQCIPFAMLMPVFCVCTAPFGFAKSNWTGTVNKCTAHHIVQRLCVWIENEKRHKICNFYKIAITFVSVCLSASVCVCVCLCLSSCLSVCLLLKTFP